MLIKLRTQSDGGATEEDLLDMQKYAAGALHKGSIYAGDFEKVFVFVLVNDYSVIRSKGVLYRVTVVDTEADITQAAIDAEQAAAGAKEEAKPAEEEAAPAAVVVEEVATPAAAVEAGAGEEEVKEAAVTESKAEEGSE
jgi:hypothetical protein